jgi:hypothetical protein
VETVLRRQAGIRSRTGAQYAVHPGSEFYPIGGSLDNVYYSRSTTGLGFACELRNGNKWSGSFILPANQIAPTSLDVYEIVIRLLVHVSFKPDPMVRPAPRPLSTI